MKPITNGPLEKLRSICLPLPETHGIASAMASRRGLCATRRRSSCVRTITTATSWRSGAPRRMARRRRLSRLILNASLCRRSWGIAARLGVRLDVPPIDSNQFADLVTDAYRAVAPKRLVAASRRGRVESPF